jgi:hypothetical protein
MPEALTDAAVIYGAQRYFDGVHDLPDWPYRPDYRKDDDRLLFLEFLHNIILYDRLHIDSSSLEDTMYEIHPRTELRSFIDKVNYRIRAEWITSENIGVPANVNIVSSQYSFCHLLKELLSRDPDAERRMRAVPVPWAYKTEKHYNYSAFRMRFDQLEIENSDLLPYAIFTWRALTYGAMAQHKHKMEHTKFAYVAAPGRLTALKAILDNTDIYRYNLPRDRELLSNISWWGLPQFSGEGFDFTYIRSLPFFETSPVALNLLELPPQRALDQVCEARNSPEAREVRDDWNDILFDVSNYSAIGNVNIQIMKNVTAQGSISQRQIIKAVPIGLSASGRDGWL